MTTRDSSDHAQAGATDHDYESMGADIVLSHARDEMQTRVSALRRRLKAAFSATPENRKPGDSADAND